MHGLLHPEFGHMRIPHDRTRDPFGGACPYHGDCFEGLASGDAVRARWGRPPEEITDQSAWLLEAEYLALGFHNVICTLSPQKIIVGGGVMNEPSLLPLVRSRVQVLASGYFDARARRCDRRLHRSARPRRPRRRARSARARATCRRGRSRTLRDPSLRCAAPLGRDGKRCPTGERAAECWGSCWGSSSCGARNSPTKPYFGLKSAEIAPRRSPVRVRLAPLPSEVRPLRGHDDFRRLTFLPALVSPGRAGRPQRRTSTNQQSSLEVRLSTVALNLSL